MNDVMDPRLELATAALRDTHASTERIDAAQQRLEQRLARRAPSRTTALRWPALAAATACAALVVVLGLLGTPKPALAFADVQRHFRDFTTLVATMDQDIGGRQVMRTTVSATRDGLVRVDVGTHLSTIIDTKAHTGTTLLHGPKRAFRFPVDGDAASEGSVDWIDELREFQGQAELLAETRTIDGHVAHGWSLELAGTKTVLWATDDGMPLEMSLNENSPAPLLMRFAFDAPIDPATFDTSIPPGYVEGAGEED
ncbi:MAG TPA: hypothetical protein VFL14_01270 [Xanthomonadales bacterium]|nr:hypothetical protein [Xanthomonadales bacterium]